MDNPMDEPTDDPAETDDPTETPTDGSGYPPSRSATAAEEAVRALDRLRGQADFARPRVALFLFECDSPERLECVLKALPDAVVPWLEEIVVVLDDPDSTFPPDAAELEGPVVRTHRSPRRRSHGAARKDAFEYARIAGFDHVVTLRADGSHPPEGLAELLVTSLENRRALVVAVGDTTRDWAWWARGLHGLAAFVQRRVLGLGLRAFRSSYRIWPRTALERIPYQLDAADAIFELETVIQFRALGADVVEVALASAPREPQPPMRLELAACVTAVGYRLHQLHVTMDGRYLVQHDVRYTLKRSPTGSHMQIVSRIRPGARVLDLGCSQGLLAGPLRKQDVQVVGVDARPASDLSEDLTAYYQCDLERPLDLPVEREFDYVVIADVIEHIRNRQQLLRGARRFLKPDGRLLISTPNIAIWFYRFSLLAGRFEYGPRGVLDETHVHLYTGASFRREIEKAGFRVLAQHVTALPFEIVFASTGRSRLVARTAGFYHALARLWPSMFAYQHILEAEITTLDDESVQ